MNHSLIEEIYQKKISEKSEDRDNLLKLTSHRLYGEKIHYALELIQNADDEEASSITFIFDKDKVTVINDSKPFDKDDVWAICSVKPGRKRNKIGFFGIGFKSVFNITNAPQIISGQYTHYWNKRRVVTYRGIYLNGLLTTPMIFKVYSKQCMTPDVILERRELRGIVDTGSETSVWKTGSTN